MRPDSMSSRARLVAWSSNSFGAVATNPSRCSMAIVGLLSTAATSGSAKSSRTFAVRRAHSSTLPSCCASSKTARAYLLAAPVGTRDLLDGLFDELPVPALVERLPDHLLRGHDDQGRHLVARGLQRAFALGLDLFARRLADPARLLLGLLPEVLADLLARLVGRLDELRSGLRRRRAPSRRPQAAARSLAGAPRRP